MQYTVRMKNPFEGFGRASRNLAAGIALTAAAGSAAAQEAPRHPENAQEVPVANKLGWTQDLLTLQARVGRIANQEDAEDLEIRVYNILYAHIDPMSERAEVEIDGAHYSPQDYEKIHSILLSLDPALTQLEKTYEFGRNPFYQVFLDKIKEKVEKNKIVVLEEEQRRAKKY